MKVIVLGAGVIGTTTAYYLNRLGCEVTVMDRQAAPAAETSFANGGEISVGHAGAWGNPGGPLKMLKWLAEGGAPLAVRLEPGLAEWIWGRPVPRRGPPGRAPRD